jgi:hypothetical protein
VSEKYDRAQRAIERHAERLKETGAAKTSEEARKRAEKVARESEKTTKHREK